MQSTTSTSTTIITPCPGVAITVTVRVDENNAIIGVYTTSPGNNTQVTTFTHDITHAIPEAQPAPAAPTAAPEDQVVCTTDEGTDYSDFSDGSDFSCLSLIDPDAE